MGTSNGRIDLAMFNTQRPSLRAEHVQGDVTVLTIAGTEVLNVRDNVTGEPRNALKVTFKEFPEHAFWPNFTSIKRLVNALGASDVDWVGHRVPLEKVQGTNPETKATVETLWVAAPEVWDDHFEGYDRAVKAARGGKSAAKKSAKKASAKKRS